MSHTRTHKEEQRTDERLCKGVFVLLRVFEIRLNHCRPLRREDGRDAVRQLDEYTSVSVLHLYGLEQLAEEIFSCRNVSNAHTESCMMLT